MNGNLFTKIKVRSDLTLLNSVVILMIFTSLLLPAGCSSTPLEANRWTGLLSVIPANESTLQAAYLRDNGLKTELEEQYHPPETPVYSFDTYFFPASGGDLANIRYYNEADWQKDLGFVQNEVERVIVAGASGPPPSRYYQAAEGHFDPAAIDNAVRTGSFHDKLETIAYHGQEYYNTGADNAIDLTIQSGAHHLGMAYKMALLDDTVLWSNNTRQMQEMIDALKNKVDSLADAENYQVLSNTLDDLKTFYAFFSSGSYSLSHIKQVYEEYKIEHQLNDKTIEMANERLAELEEAVLLKPIEALASGVGLDENGYYLVIAMANADEATARQNAILLEQRLNQANDTQFNSPWTTLMDGKREISYDGNITTAKLYGEAWKLWRLSVYEAPMWGFFLDAFLVTE